MPGNFKSLGFDVASNKHTHPITTSLLENLLFIPVKCITALPFFFALNAFYASLGRSSVDILSADILHGDILHGDILHGFFKPRTLDDTLHAIGEWE
ncbi:hypothetical protein PG985_005532 [Apiospora marii]|uniref:uncharacterized protein n=1 Tax=Apiospora marii TaxID=335849 RepID=UPI00312CF937